MGLVLAVWPPSDPSGGSGGAGGNLRADRGGALINGCVSPGSPDRVLVPGLVDRDSLSDGFKAVVHAAPAVRTVSNDDTSLENKVPESLGLEGGKLDISVSTCHWPVTGL